MGNAACLKPESLRTSQALLATEIPVVGPDSDFDNRTAIDREQHAPCPAYLHANVRRESPDLDTRLQDHH